MPYKAERYKLVGTRLDRRRKLSDEDKQEIRQLYPKKSQRALARQYDVSRRLIQYILDPKKHEANLQRRAERGGSKAYYDKDKHREYMQNHRHYKQRLYLKGEIGEGVNTNANRS